MPGEKIDWRHVGISAGAGALSGGLAGTGIGIGALIAGNAVIGAGESVAHDMVDGKTTQDIVTNAAINGMSTAFFTGVGNSVAGIFERPTSGTKIINIVYGITEEIPASRSVANKAFWINTANGAGTDFAIGRIQSILTDEATDKVYSKNCGK